MVRLTSVTVLAACIAAGPALADFQKVSDRDTFISLVDGRTLTRPFVRLEVSPEGGISGTGAVWEVTGAWKWQDGYFCRDLEWGGDDLGYNCQEVRADGNRLRFTSDRGTGRSADFRLQ